MNEWWMEHYTHEGVWQRMVTGYSPQSAVKQVYKMYTELGFPRPMRLMCQKQGRPARVTHEYYPA